MTRSRFFNRLPALRLQFWQLGAAVHALSHLQQVEARTGTQREKQAAPDEVCVTCLAFSALSAAATSQHACPESLAPSVCAKPLPA